MYDIEEIRKNYRTYPNEKIIRIAKYESKGLRKDVVSILKEEIVIRNLDQSLLNWINAETAEITKEERRSILNKIIALPCPECNQQNTYLRGYKIYKIWSVIIDSQITVEKKILCRKCGSKMKSESFLLSLVAGWWSARGLFFTPFILIGNIINFLFQGSMSRKVLNEFIDNNIGRIRLRKTESGLYNLIFGFNKKIESD